jgi:4-hydroxybenzoate polyprenyltransferase
VTYGYVRRWGTFIEERFPPLVNLPMVIVFTGANAMAARWASEGIDASWRLAGAFLLALSFFGRLRIFDEVKDYATDCAVNPHRPLARGLISVPEARRTAFALLIFEGLLAIVLGPIAGAVWTVAFLFSLLMYREFFAGSWLRPRMELYAVAHTFVAVLLSLTVFACVAPRLAGKDAWVLLPFALASWAVFNVYEFARKTFAPSQERSEVESYSSRLGCRAAAALTVSQGVIAGALAWSLPLSSLFRSAHVCLMVLLAGAGLLFAIRQTARAARLLQAMAGVFILGFYCVAGVGLLRR